jgi:hypothetical protein
VQLKNISHLILLFEANLQFNTAIPNPLKLIGTVMDIQLLLNVNTHTMKTKLLLLT